MERKKGRESRDGRITIVYEPIDRLILDPRNPRLHSPRQIRQMRCGRGMSAILTAAGAAT